MEFKKTKLKNGMTILFEKRDVPVTTVMLACKFGSLYESEEEKGIAHFIEHLCFKGTKKRTHEQISSELEGVGGTLNAFTSEEETAYHVKLPSEHLGIAIEIISDIFFNPVFPEEEIEKERQVIMEEIKMYKDNPRFHVLESIKSCLYNKPFGIFTAGTEESMRKIKREQILEKHKDYYCPDNSILVVVGNNNFEEIVKLAEKFSVERKFERKEFPVIKKKIEQKTEKRGGIEQANLCMGFHFPFDNRRYAVEIFNSILGEGMSSKLFNEVREKRGLAYAVKSGVEEGKNYGYLIIYVGTDKNKIEEAKKACLDVFSSMKNLSEKELEDAKIKVIGNYRVQSGDSANVVLNLLIEEVTTGKAEDYYKYEEKIKNVSLNDMKELADIKDFSYFALVP